MSDTFSELYSSLSKDIFLQHAQEQLAKGQDALLCAQGYAEQGKPDFTLAFLLEMSISPSRKQELYARSFSRRAELTIQKATQFERQFRRSFSLLKMEADNDVRAANMILAGDALTPAEAKQ